MPLIKKILYTSLLVLLISISQAFAGDLKKVGKFKDWEVIVISEADSKVCFAQSIPVLQAPKKISETQDYLLHLDLMKKFLMK